MKTFQVFRWINQKIRQYNKSLYILMILSSISSTAAILTLTYIPRIIVDAIINKQGIGQIIFYIVILGVVSFLHTNLKNLLEAKIKKTEYVVSDNLKQKLGSLVMNMKFIHLETPEVLDKYEIAYKSLMHWSGGLENYPRTS